MAEVRKKDAQFWAECQNSYHNLQPTSLRLLDTLGSVIRYLLEERAKSAEGDTDNPPPLKICELGCNEGRHLHFLQENYQDLELHGCDINRLARRRCRQNFLSLFGELNLVAGPEGEFCKYLTDLPKKTTFDIIFSHGRTLEWSEQQRALGELVASRAKIVVLTLMDYRRMIDFVDVMNRNLILTEYACPENRFLAPTYSISPFAQDPMRMVFHAVWMRPELMGLPKGYLVPKDRA